MTKLGMDVEQISSLAERLAGQAHALDRVIAAVESLVARAGTDWHGQDAQDFAGWWHNKHKPALRSASSSVAGLARAARDNVAEQHRVSGATLPGAVSGLRNLEDSRAPQHLGPLHRPVHPDIPPVVAPPHHGGGIAAADFHGGKDAFLADWHVKWVGKDGTPFDQWGFGYQAPRADGTGGDCTSFVAWRLNELAKARGLDWSFTNSSITGATHHVVLGNARDWGAHATTAGFPPDQNPTVGSVAWFGSPHDHVAIVKEVDGRQIRIEESNYDGKTYDTKVIDLDHSSYRPSGFIHFLPGT